jgi:hypothetical protein
VGIGTSQEFPIHDYLTFVDQVIPKNISSDHQNQVISLSRGSERRSEMSRAAAVRELLKRGLAAEGFVSAEVGQRSNSFGVVANANSTNTSTDEGSVGSD